MVSRRSSRRLMVIMRNLEWTRIACENVTTHNMKLGVKGEGYLLFSLKNVLPTFEMLTNTFKEFKNVPISIKKWLRYLDENYDDITQIQPRKDVSKESVAQTQPQTDVSKESVAQTQPRKDVSKEDAEKLLKEVTAWQNLLLKTFSRDGTVLLTDELLNNLIPKKLKKKLDIFESGDLSDGINSLRNLLPTPAAIILLRVAERVLQRYYKKITKTSSGKKTWGQMLAVLEKTKKVDKSLLGYLYFLNEKRIDSAHPYRRYTQEESERILLNVKDLLDAVYLPRKRTL